MTVVLMMLAGGLGAVARFVVDALLQPRGDRPAAARQPVPVATLVINAAGSLLSGLFVGLAIAGRITDDALLVLGTGFCGGFTTFSTASLELVRLVQQRRHRTAAGLCLVMLGACMLTALAGVTAGRALG